MNNNINKKYASRAGEKLEFALATFQTDVSGLVCADFGSSTGGFTDCLLQHGANKVYAVETGYGLLDWKLRNDARVVVLERTNAVHVELPEQVDLLTIDTGWTKQSAILPSAYKNLKINGRVISLVKLSFEAGGQSRQINNCRLTQAVCCNSLLRKPSLSSGRLPLPPKGGSFKQGIIKSQPDKNADDGSYNGSHKDGAPSNNYTQQIEPVLQKVEQEIADSGFFIIRSAESPILGAKGKNIEYLYLLEKNMPFLP